MQEAQQGALLAAPVHRSSRPIGTIDWRAPRPPQRISPPYVPPSLRPTTINARPATSSTVPTTVSQASAATVPARLEYPRQQVVIVPNDPVESFVLDLTALQRTLTVQDVESLERSLQEARAKGRGESWTFRAHITQTTVRELTDFFELFHLPFENEWDLTHHPDDYFTILRTVANKTGATGSQRYVDAGTPLRIAAFIADVFYVEEGLQPDSVNDLNKRILAVCNDIREGIQKCLRYKLLTDPLPVVKGDSKTYSQATTGGKVQFQTPATQSSSSTSTSSTQMVIQPTNGGTTISHTVWEIFPRSVLVVIAIWRIMRTFPTLTTPVHGETIRFLRKKKLFLGNRTNDVLN